MVRARRVLAQFDAGGQPVTFDNLTWALEFADVAIDALYDAGSSTCSLALAAGTSP